MHCSTVREVLGALPSADLQCREVLYFTALELLRLKKLFEATVVLSGLAGHNLDSRRSGPAASSLSVGRYTLAVGAWLCRIDIQKNGTPDEPRSDISDRPPLP